MGVSDSQFYWPGEWFFKDQGRKPWRVDSNVHVA